MGCMRIFNRSTLTEFAAEHAPAATAVGVWLNKVKRAHWEKPEDALADFPSAKIINAERIRFQLGDNYRLIISFD